jgi:hypothetical protein
VKTLNSPWIAVSDFDSTSGWADSSGKEAHARDYCQQLEQGHILFFPELPFLFEPQDRQFLIAQPWGELRLHKNVSYRPATDLLRGYSGDAETAKQLHAILRTYSQRVADFLSRFLSPYAGKWILDFASFRPLEEESRDLPLHKRNDLLHVDAFPSRPTRGARILRVFTNLNPARARIWQTTDNFERLAGQYANPAGLLQFAQGESVFKRVLGATGRAIGLTQFKRTPYDAFMLRFHDYLKENSEFQANCPKIRLEFPPLATWLVFTDSVAHAALSGQYALEQTLLIPPEALVAKEHAPFRVLERLAGRPLV